MRRSSQRIMSDDLSADGRRGMLQAIPLGGEHVEELTAAPHEGVELLQHRIRQGTRIGPHTSPSIWKPKRSLVSPHPGACLPPSPLCARNSPSRRPRFQAVTNSLIA
jgi:hypothetical protein